ncbi:DUF805 domain-containing protein [Knoellia sp. S7-12]|uniref:DUF805 domain-containing protein n=1 Tax=Knoellia sp. S7-12 TaxID=3126698 RepID=UPI003367F906
MNFWTAIASVFRQYAVFSGRAGRPEYWWFFLFSAVLSVATGALDSSMFPSLVSDPGSGFAVSGGPLSAIFGLATLIPTLAVSARRFHDTGRSGWWTLIWLIPVVGWIMAIVMCAQVGQRVANEYGPPATSPALATT